MRYKKSIIATLLSAVLVVGINVAKVSALVPGVNKRVDVTSGGTLGDGNSGYGALSRDGRYVAFTSSSTNLVSGDTNGQTDVFVRNNTTGAITRASVASDGTQANSYSQGTIGISDDGRYVVFSSNASNLVSGDTNGTIDIFVHDMQTGATNLVSSSSGGTKGNGASQDPVISGDGKFVAFDSYATNLVSTSVSHANIFVKNLVTGDIQLISQNGGTSGNADSWSPSLSCDGGVVAFFSGSTNLASGSDTNGQADVFVDTRAGGDSLTNITLGSDHGAADAVVSCDGMHVAYDSVSTNLVPSDTNGQQDVFTYDRRNNTTALASVNSSGNQANDSSSVSAISSDGRLVAFASSATNLTSVDTNGANDVFIRDTVTNTTDMVSINSSGTQGNATSSAYLGSSGFSGDRKYLYFYSAATNLVSGDTNKANGVIAQTGL